VGFCCCIKLGGRSIRGCGIATKPITGRCYDNICKFVRGFLNLADAWCTTANSETVFRSAKTFFGVVSELESSISIPKFFRSPELQGQIRAAEVLSSRADLINTNNADTSHVSRWHVES
jgi:hypothetical protein